MLIDPDPNTIRSLLARQAQVHGAATAMLAPGKQPLTYAALAFEIERLCASLAGMGIGRGSRVAVVLPDGPEMAVALLAVTAAAVCAPLNPNDDLDSYRRALKTLRIDALLVLGGHLQRARQVATELGLKVVNLRPSETNVPGSFDLVSDGARAGSLAEGPEGGDVAVLLHTSGTTSAAKIVPLTQFQLLQRSKEAPIDHSDRCLCVAPLFTGSAFGMNLLTPITAGASVVVASGLGPADLIACLNQFKPTYLSGSPTVLGAMLREIERRPPGQSSSLRFIRSTSIALPTSLKTQLEIAFRAPVVAAYSMTETGRIADSPLDQDAQREGSVGIPLIPMSIRSDDGTLLAAGNVGEILVRGPGVMAAYEANAEANGNAFLDGWFRTGDLGYVDDDGYLFLTGRKKELINRGGPKVAPTEVDLTLLRHPSVTEAATFPVPHPTLGEDVAAAVVLRRANEVNEQQLREFAAANLAAHKVPSRIMIVPELPKNALGKVRRDELATMLAVAPKPNIRVNASNQTELHLVKLWEKFLRVSPIGVEDNFFALGGDSLLAAQLFAEIERLFGRRLPLDALWFGGPTIAHLASLLIQDEQPGTWPMLVPIKSEGSKAPLFCVHTQGGNLFHYYELAQYLDIEQPVFGLQARGVYGGATPRHSIRDIAADCISAMRQRQTDGPFRIVGYSSGGTIAIEMARQLHGNGDAVGLLVLIDAGVRGRLRRANRVGQLHRRGLRYVQERAYHWLLHALRRPDLRRLHKVGEAQRWAFWSHVPSPYSGDAHLFAASESVQNASGDETLGWGRLISGRLTIHHFTGDHASIMKAPAVREVASVLQRDLDGAITP